MDNSKQASQAEPTIEEIKEWDKNKLLKWIQQKRRGLLEGDNLKTFEATFIRGRVFVKHAGDVEFFKHKCGLPIGISEELADLASEIAGVEIAGGETAGMKSKLLSFMSCTPRRQQANNVTGNRQQAEDVELSYRQSRKSLAPFIC
jgi:hypothetical protein